MDMFIGIDMGTSACRGMAVDNGGRVAAQAREALPPSQCRGNEVEQDPRLWWHALVQVIQRLCHDIDTATVTAIAVDATSATLVLVDQHGAPLGPALMYNDARSDDAARRIGAIAPAESGAHGASSSLAKLLHLQRQGLTATAGWALHQADWLAARLSGRWGISDENNSLKLGYDPVARGWPPWLDDLGVDTRLLPEVVPPGTCLGRVTPEVARELGLSAQTQVMAGTTDSVAAFIASGARRSGDAVTSLGSTLVLKVMSETPVFAPRYGVYSHRWGDKWLAGGASNSGGAVLRQFFDDEQLRTLSRQLQPEQPSPLDYYPLPGTGERFPVSDAGLAPRLTPRPADDVQFLHGLLEGIARIERDGYRLLQRLGAPYPAAVRTVGGGAQNPAWSAIRQRLLGVPLEKALSEEAAYGAALLSMSNTKSK